MPWCTADRAPPALGLRQEQKRRPGPAPGNSESAHSTCPLRNVYTRVHSSPVSNSQQVGTTLMPTNE